MPLRSRCSGQRPRHQKLPTPSRRAGISLGEILFVISLSSVLLMISGVLIQELLRADRGVRRTEQASSTLLRLESLFRDDVHRAATWSVPHEGAGASKLELVLPTGEQVTYSTHEHILRRVVTAGDKREHFESFIFPQESVITLQPGNSANAVELRIDRSRKADRGAALPQFYAPQVQRIVAHSARFDRPGGEP